MNKVKLFSAVLLLAGSLLQSHAQRPSGYNLDVEQMNRKNKPEGWYFTFSDGSNSHYVSEPDSTQAQHGRYSIHIGALQKPEAEHFGVCSYSIPAAFDGKMIRLTGYLKTKNVAGGYAGLWMRIDGKDGSTLEFDNMESRGVAGTTGWTAYSIEYAYDSKKAASIEIGALLTGSGDMWVDNLEVMIDGHRLADVPPRVLYLAAKDSSFNRGSGIEHIALNKDKVKQLADLGMVWGFIKYYHPRVAAGDFNMDAELFRLLPQIQAATTGAQVFSILESWVDKMGAVSPCKRCAPPPAANIKLMADYGNLFTPGYLPESLKGKLAAIRDNRDSVEEHYYVDLAFRISNPVFNNEQLYRGSYPDAGTRLLALYRYWNMVHYFFPDRHLITGGWNPVLAENIPVFINAENEEAYTLACLKLIASIGDTHANIWNNNEVLERIKGKNTVPIKAIFLEEKLVVADYYNEDTTLRNKLRPGVVISAIDGVPVADLVKKYLPLTPASNYDAQLRDLPGLNGFLMRTGKETMKLTLSGAAPEVIELATIPLDKAKRPVIWEVNTGDKGYTTLKNNIGYIYPAKLKEGDIDAIAKAFQHTKGVIVDFRCYPSTYMPYSFGFWLKAQASPFVRHTRGSLTWPGNFLYSQAAENGGSDTNAYKGKLVILVNASTQSSAEYTTMALSSAKGAVVLGSTTSGADGNVSEINLPGGIMTWISGIGVLYPDGTESQRAGVKIDIRMKPTIASMKNGKDELLEEAIKIINR